MLKLTNNLVLYTVSTRILLLLWIFLLVQMYTLNCGTAKKNLTLSTLVQKNIFGLALSNDSLVC